MNITIKINTDNATFQDNPAGELSMILDGLKRKNERIEGNFQLGEEFYLYDTNGNNVGEFSVTE